MNNNVVISVPTNNNITVVTDENTLAIANPVTNVVEILTGPQGKKGDQGPVGPSGSVDTGSLVTTSSFNSFTSSFNTGSFTGSFTGSILSSNFANSGNTSIGAVQERFIIVNDPQLPSASFDFNSGSIFYVTRQEENIPWNIINLPTTPETAITLTFIVEQNDPPYSASVYEFDGQSVSVKWPQGVAPTGSANVVDAIGLTAFYVDSSWTVLGSLTPFL
jgi:hypothetical protein